MSAEEHWEAGRLDDAVQAAIEDVRNEPGNGSRRLLLAELLLFTGDWERADKQLDAVLQGEQNLVLQVTLLRQLLRAERDRQALFSSGHPPEVLDEPDAALSARLKAVILAREGAGEEAARSVAEADAASKPLSGTLNGQAFTGFRDLSDLTADVFELLTSTGKYYWVPMSRVLEMVFRPIESPRDLIWRAVEINVSNGPEGVVYLPSLYAGSDASSDDAIRLGRATDWVTRDGGPCQGIGQRMFLVGEGDKALGEMEELHFEQS